MVCLAQAHFPQRCAFGGAQVCAHAGGSRAGLSFNGSLVPKVPAGGSQCKTPLTATLLTWVFELPLPASAWWVFPHTGGDGFPSLALRIPAGGFQCVKLKLEFLKLHHFVALSRWDPAFQRCCRAPRLLPDCSFCQGKQTLGAGENTGIKFSICSGCAGLPISISKAKLPLRALLGNAWECCVWS